MVMIVQSVLNERLTRTTFVSSVYCRSDSKICPKIQFNEDIASLY